MNASVDEGLIARIGKLLALAGNNPNEHEAAAAAAKAQALMDEHGIAVAEVEKTGRGVRAHISALGVMETTKVPTWRLRLLQYVAKTSYCSLTERLVKTGEKSSGANINKRVYNLIGRPADTEVALYLLNYLSKTLERLADGHVLTRTQTYAKAYLGAEPERGAKKRWRVAFLVGAAEGVGQTLFARYHERRGNNAVNALIVVRGDEIAQYLGEKNVKKGRQDQHRKRAVDPRSFSQGIVAGQRVQINEGLKG